MPRDFWATTFRRRHGMRPLREAFWDSGLAVPTAYDRERRLRSWLKSFAIRLPDEAIAVLALCDSGSELQFAIPVLTLDGWRRDGDRSFTDSRHRLVVQALVGPLHVDFALGARFGTEPITWAIEIDGPDHLSPEGIARDAQRDAIVRDAGYRVVRIPSSIARRVGFQLRTAILEDRGAATSTA